MAIKLSLNIKTAIFLTIMIIIISSIILSSIPKEHKETTLQLVHVVFRHCDRTTERHIIYPKDPHINETYYPYGLGELTNKGKQRCYKLGKVLRKKYGRFLDHTYTYDVLEAYSSNVNRTKMSLQVVLASLFPPVGHQLWQFGLYWQPIPYTTLPARQDNLFFGLLCSNFSRHFGQVLSSPEILQETQEYQDVLKHITENSGKVVRTFWDALRIYMCLKDERDWGLKLPEWTESVFPHPLEEISVRAYELLTATIDLKRIFCGGMLQKILDDTKGKIDGKPGLKNRKIYIYSGHDINIASLLNTLVVNYTKHMPPYASHIAFELHKINSVDGFKIYYQKDLRHAPQLLKLPDCDEFCPLDKFMSLLQKFLPTDNLCA